MIFRILLIFAVFFTPSCYGGKWIQGTEGWSHHIHVGINDMEIKWNIDDPHYIVIEITGKAKGYLGLGFSHNGNMAGADIFIGWVDNNGVGHIKDYHGGSGNGMPILDSQQDLELLEASEDAGGTRLRFRRKWDTCDPNDFKIGEDTMQMIFAWHPQDPYDENSPPYHGKGVGRGARALFMKQKPQHKKFPDEDPNSNVQYHDFKMTNYVVQNKETEYFCKIVKFPKIEGKRHMIGYRPLLSTESAPYVHHINLFRCHIPEQLGLKNSDVFEKYMTHPGTHCYTSDSPTDWVEFCNTHGIAFAVGNEGELLPEHLGDLIEDDGSGVYFKMEVHYENPTDYRLVDNSGVRIFYTDELRPFEIATLFVGHRRTPFLTIPPYQKSFTNYGFCTSECTQIGFPPTGIKIFSVLLHAHLTGRGIILRHIRNGVELPPIAEDRHYDFSYQVYRMLPTEVTVLPGDELIVECEFETTKNDTFIYGGLSTRREMCEAFVEYYPRATLIDCRSQPEFYSYFNAYGIENVTSDIFKTLTLPYDPKLLPKNKSDLALIDDSVLLESGHAGQVTSDIFKQVEITKPANLAHDNAQWFMNKLHWKDQEFSKNIEQKWKNGPHYMHCATKGGRRIKTTNHIKYYPKFVKYQSPPDVCHNNRQRLSSSSAKILPTFLTIIFITFLTRFAFQ